MTNWCERCNGFGKVFTLKPYPGTTFWEHVRHYIWTLFHVTCPVCQGKKIQPPPIQWDAQVKFDQIDAAYKHNLALHGLGYPDDSPPIDIFTCARCPVVKECNLAFDAYNTNGDCLADK